jgi:hypothetical protein
MELDGAPFFCSRLEFLFCFEARTAMDRILGVFKCEIQAVLV